jgi:hypothetical protein
MNNSKYAPLSSVQYSSKDLNAAHKGMKFSANASTQTVQDMQITDDVLIDGAVLITINAALGDKASFQVIDKDNVLGMGTNVVLGQYITDWYINPSETKQLEFSSIYPAKVFAGLYLRAIYDSVGSQAVDVIVNYKLHKILW